MNRAALVFALLLLVAVPLSLMAGRVWIDPATTPNASLILAELRLPRALLAIVVGGGLGAAGAAMQGYLRNPLADPGLFGIAPGAALGAVVALWFYRQADTSRQGLRTSNAQLTEANRKVRYLTVSVNPVASQEPSYPRKFENTILAFLLFAGIYLMISLTASVLREQVSS